jgi:2-amino-4-hydroxy-6-hydroxymethyldihydropteridine diphosphokinase
VRTHLSPHALLARLKHVESSLGRDIKGGVRFGPRPIDIDILLFGPDVVLDDSFCKDTSGEPDVHSANHSSEATGGWLTLPHPRLEERIFVLAPLCDIAPGLRHPINGRTMAELLGALGTHPLLSDGSSELPNALPGDIDGYTQLCPVLPFASSIGGQVLRYCEGTSLMGVVNATPDSFSDGGQFGN